MSKILNWEEFLFPYQQAVNELVLKFQSITDEYKLRGLYSPIESVKGRVKKSYSILEKAERKNIPDDMIEELIEDIAGVRILCQFVDDIEKIVEIVRSRDGIDLRVIEEKDYITNTKPSGYRSYHMIIAYTLMTSRGYRELLVEIQIRTLAMNFWATAEHSLKYKYNRNLPEELQERLVRSAEAAFWLDKEMNTIRDDIMQAQRLNERRDRLTLSIIENLKRIYASDKVTDIGKIDNEYMKAMEGGDVFKMENFNRELEALLEKIEAEEK